MTNDISLVDRLTDIAGKVALVEMALDGGLGIPGSYATDGAQRALNDAVAETIAISEVIDAHMARGKAKKDQP